MATVVTRRASDYEITVDGVHAGLSAFQERSGTVVFTHTEIDDAFEGKGIGSQLARAALDDVRQRGLSVVPLCPFIKEWIGRHPDYADLVKQDS
ncbi:MAG: acetyltransferase family protein [Frankiales bacterium]|nr:acetyltransferase family protein [Frankiales bacterium]